MWNEEERFAVRRGPAANTAGPRHETWRDRVTLGDHESRTNFSRLTQPDFARFGRRGRNFDEILRDELPSFV